MSDITLRLVKGLPLTNQEVDDNFANLNTDKYQAGDSASFQDVTLDNMSGPITWNVDDGTVDVPLNAQVTLQLGQEFVFYAKATEAIANGDVVMFAGAQGGHLLIAKCDMGAVGFDPSHIVGIATQSFAINDFGYVTSSGKVRGIDTSGFTEGTILYVDPTTAGGYTSTKPTPPNHIVQIAAVTRSHATQGTILTRVSHMPDTDEVPEGSTNLYFTDARAVSAIKADGDWNATNWNTAYGWGDHSTEGYLTSIPSEYLTQTEGDDRYLSINATTLPDQTGHSGQFLTTNGTTADWATVDTSLGDTAYGWGDHASAGYLTTHQDISGKANLSGATFTGPVTFTEQGSTFKIDPHTVGVDLYSSGNLAPHYQTNFTLYTGNIGTGVQKLNLDSSGNLSVTGTLSASGYNKTNWDTAYGWGNHASAGYLTSLPSHNHNDLYYTETESDSRFVNVTGDTMTGPLVINGNGSYVGSYGYNTLVLQDQSDYPGLNFSHSAGNRDWLQRMNGSNASMEWVYRDGGNYSEKMLLNTSGSLTLNGDVRTPTFYDSNNTGYYTNPASTSNLNTLSVVGKADFQGDAAIEGGSGYGIFKGYSTNNNHMIVVRGSVTGSGSSPTITGTHQTTFCEFMNPRDDTAGWFFKDSYNNGAYSYSEIARITVNGLTHSSSVRAPIFYDSNNTGYYGDFASNSSINQLRTVGHISVGSHGDSSASTVDTTAFITFGSLTTDAVNNYSIGTRKENYGGNYNKLDLAFHTGIRLGAHPNYGGVRFFSDQTMGTEIASIGKSGNYILGNNSVRSPIFYDSNDTAFFVDPNSTSKFAHLETYKNVPIDVYRDTRGSGTVLYDITSGLEHDAQVTERNGSGTAGSVDAVMPAGCPAAGGKGISITSGYNIYSDYIEVEPGEVLMGEVWARKDTSNTVRFYYGIERFDKDKRPIASNTGCTYFVAANSALSSSWTKYTAYHTVPTSHTPYGGSDGSGVKYVRVRFLGNYQTSGQAYYAGLKLVRANKNQRLLNDVHTPRTYDINNTGYYVDPASTSNTNVMKAYEYRGNGNVAGTGEATYHPAGIYSTSNNWLYGTMYRNGSSTYYGGGSQYQVNRIECTQNYGEGVYGVYSASRLQHLWSMGTAYKLAANGTTSGNMYGIAWSHPNAGTIGGANNLASHGMLILENGVFKGAWGGGRFVTPSDIRGALYYDYDNTGYYWNPNTSGAHRLQTPSGYLDIGPMNSTYCHFQTDRSEFYFDKTIRTDGAGIRSYDAYANANFPVYYDYNDTSCLMNLNGTSQIKGQLDIRENVSSPGYTFMKFQAYSTGNTLGSIYRQYGSMYYSTNSDYRLKENVVELTSASSRVNELSVKRFNFIGYPGRTVDGFLAHEVASVVPEAVIGEHNEVDEEGNPVYQSIDQSKLVPLLTAGLQEALAKIEELETRLSLLESN